MVKEIKVIPIEDIQPNANQPRKSFDDESLAELAESIKAVGIIQPLTVKELGGGKYSLISGERRLRASKIAGLSAVPCVLLRGEGEDFDLMSLIENIQREDINYFEEALAYKQLIERFGFTQQQLAAKIGKTQSTVANKLRLLKLGSDVIEKIIEYRLTERHARVLLTIPDSKMRLEALEKIYKRGLNVRQSEKLVEDLKSQVLMNSSKTNIKNYFNYRIYTNTIKQAFETIVKTGLEADYSENKFPDKVQVVITIPIAPTGNAPSGNAPTGNAPSGNTEKK
ncbi:MAG: ParB/RepB/Spo0J family partition protein [Eubacteriaceae bacterium]|nr:ParB/RepB/Spo0J family partition protein [Eubacteriaceae bacterium]